jgi:hypothetical protein
VFASSSLIFWLGIITPLVLVCLIFVVVGRAGSKQEELSEPVDSSPRRSSE